VERIALSVGGRVALVIMGVNLARYADANDAPGYVVIGWLLLAGGAVASLKGVLGVPPSQPRA
jgi:hypothetical protein